MQPVIYENKLDMFEFDIKLMKTLAMNKNINVSCL